jgi:hypothetical protein
VSKKFFLIFFLLWFSNLFANGCLSEEDSISMELTSPLLIEGNPGEVLYFSALVCNKDPIPFCDEIEITGPGGWSYSPKIQKVALGPHESKVLIYGIKIPTSALAGEHALTVSLIGNKELTRSAIVYVKPRVDIVTYVDGLCENFNLSQKAHLTVRYTNKGNVPLNVVVQTSTEPICPLYCQNEPFEIAPYETCEVPITLSPDTCLAEYSQFLLVKLIDVDTGEQLYQNPMTLKFYASAPINNDPFMRVPAYFKMLALGDHGQAVVAGEFAGGGLIDQKKERYLDFFFRIPTDSKRVIYNIDQYLYAEVYDKEWDYVLGDAIYELSPLTQYHRFGRGAGVEHYGEEWDTGVHFTQNQLSGGCNPQELCTYLEYHPYDCWSVSTNYLRKTEKNIPTSNIVSLQTEVELPAKVYSELEPAKVYSELELGKNFVNTTKCWDNCAYRFETHSRFFKDSWFSLEKLYAGREFYGYYNHLHLLCSSLDVPLCNKFRLNLNGNRFKQNFDACEEEKEDENYVIPSQHEYDGSITFRMNASCSFAVNGMLMRGQDTGAGEQYNFYQKWSGFSFFYTNCGFNLNTIVSFGQQYDYETKHTTHWLQRYYVFLSRTFNEKLSGSLFYDAGNINYYDVRPWRSIYGGSLNYRFSTRGCLEFFAQKVNQNPDMVDLTQVSFNYTYTFRNLHKFQAMAQYFNYKKHYSNDTMFLISYSIPLSVPINRRSDVGNLSGVVYNPCNQSVVSGALVRCAERYTTTGPDGRFNFACLPLGKFRADLEQLPGDLISKESEDSFVEIMGAENASMNLAVVPACSIKGVITIYEFKDMIALIKNPELSPEVVPLQGVSNVTVAISRENGTEIYSQTTNIKGEFYFPKLRPGNWQIKVFTEQLPPLYHLDVNNLIIEIEPGEQQILSFKIIPQTPKVYNL